MKKAIRERLRVKTPEQQLINRLRKEFEFSPAECRGVVEVAQESLASGNGVRVGQVKYIGVHKEARHGKPLEELAMKEVILSVDLGEDDQTVQSEQGGKALRQRRIMRMTEEALEQDVLLTQEDLGRILGSSSRTIRTDIKELRAAGYYVHTRGQDNDIGKGVSHKVWIIGLYLDGKTYAEICRQTRHSAEAIKRYIVSFGRLLLLKRSGIDDVKRLSVMLNQSEKLTKEYLDLFVGRKNGDRWPKRYVEMIEQLQALYPPKKKGVGGIARRNYRREGGW